MSIDLKIVQLDILINFNGKLSNHMGTVNELFSAIEKVHKVYSSSDFSQEMSTIRTLLEQSNKSFDDRLNTVQPMITTLADLLEKIKVADFNNEQIKYLDRAGILNYIGEYGARKLHDATIEGRANANIGVKSILNRLSEITKQVKTTSRIYSALEPFKIEPLEGLLPGSPEKGIIEITFQKGASIYSFDSAAKLTKEWDIILKAYSQALNVEYQQFGIVSITQNSPVKFRLKPMVATVTVILGITNGVFDLINNLSDMYKAHNVLNSIVLPNGQDAMQSARDVLAKEIEDSIENALPGVVNKAIENSKVKVEEAGKAALIIGAKAQYNFIINGGDVNIYLPPGTDEEGVKQLEVKRKEIQALREQVPLKAIAAPDESVEQSESHGPSNSSD